MPYFQNPLDSEFMGNLLLSDRQFTMTFRIKGNLPNSNQLFRAWNPEPFNLSTNNTLTLNYSFDAGKSWTVLAINVSTTATSHSRASAALANDVVTDLNNNATFTALFTATVEMDKGGSNYVVITSSRAREQWKVYVSNTGAEQALRFNKKAGVAELPSYFARHTIANVRNYPDSVGMLVQLDPTTIQDQNIIQQANLSYPVGVANANPLVVTGPNGAAWNTQPFQVGDSVVVFDGTNTLSGYSIASITSSTSLTLSSGSNWTYGTENAQLIDVHADWQLLKGRSGLFQFQNFTNDTESNLYRPLTVIEYPAGALPGDLALKTEYKYPAAATSQPSAILQYPYVLTANDLVVP